MIVLQPAVDQLQTNIDRLGLLATVIVFGSSEEELERMQEALNRIAESPEAPEQYRSHIPVIQEMLSRQTLRIRAAR